MEVELLSVHVPKTAGTSFRQVLDRYYGGRLFHLYDRPKGTPPKGLDRAAAVHGHFPLEPLTEACPNAKVVAWLRDPVERIASYHRFWTSRPARQNPRHEEFLAGDRSLESLARIQADEVRLYLGDDPLERLDFVGIVERFSEDVRRFESWLWQELRRPPRVWPVIRWATSRRRWISHDNWTDGATPIPPERRAHLEEILCNEVDLYRKALRRNP